MVSSVAAVSTGIPNQLFEFNLVLENQSIGQICTKIDLDWHRARNIPDPPNTSKSFR